MLKSKTSKGCGCLCLIVGLAVIALFIESAHLIDFALKPEKNDGRDYKAHLAGMKRHYPWTRQWIDSLQRANALRDTFIMVPGGDRRLFGSDSTRLHALIVNAPHPTPRTAVLVHGYTDCAIDMLHWGYVYCRQLGMNLLIPDLHANGKSGGEVMQMGWKDREDVLRWIAIADNLFKDSTGHARILLHGLSMGAATTMNVAGLDSPVKCFIEDCGYSSVWDEFSYEIGEQFDLPAFPLLYSASALCKLKYGWSFGEASPLRQVAKCRKPMLFIHGGADTYVPTRMVFQLYAAKPAPKYLVVFHGSHHARSYQNHRLEYERRIKAFVRRYL